MKVEGRTFVVSGGSSGLGLATVERLLAAKAYVAILDRSEPPSSLSTKSAFFELDITDVDQVEKTIEDVVSWTKQTAAPLGGVINCAGVGLPTKIIEWKEGKTTPHSLDAWNFVIGVNLTGTFNLTRLVLAHLVKVEPEGEDGERGVVIMVSSAAAYEGQPGQVAYSATKGAVASMALPMSRDLARYGVRVVTIAPGVFESAMTAMLSPRARKNLQNVGSMYPARFGKPEEFAQTVNWIVECPFVNGETIRLSGAGRLPGKL